MADSVVRLRIDSQEYDRKIRQAGDALASYFDQVKKGGGTLKYLDEGVLDAVKALGRMETTSNTVRGKISELSKAFTELSARYKSLTEEEKAAPFGKELAKSLEELKARVLENKSQLNDINKDLGNTATSSNILSGSLEELAGKFGMNVSQIKNFAGVAGATTLALKVIKDAFFESETNVDAWGRTVEASGSIYQAFLQTLNNGDFSGFLSGISSVVSAAKDAYDAIDELNTRMTIINPERAKLQARSTELKAEIRRNGADSAAGKKAQSELKKLEPALAKSYDTESKMNYDAFVAKVKQRLAEGGIKLSEAEMGAFISTMSDDRLFRQFRANAKGSKGTKVVGETAYSQGYTVRYDTRNKNQKLLDLFTDEWRAQNSGYLTASYNARGTAASMRMGNSRYLKESSGTAGGRAKGAGETKAVAGSIDEQMQKVSDLQKKWRAAADDTSREDIKKQLDEAQAVLDRMQGKVAETFPEDSVAALNAEISKLQKEQQLVTSNEGWKEKQVQIDALKKKIQEVQGEMSKLTAMEAFAQGGIGTTDISAFIMLLQSEIQNSDIGSELYNKLTGQLKDAAMMQEVIQMAIAGGVQDTDLSEVATTLKQKILAGDIDDAAWQELITAINEKFDNEEFKIKLSLDGSLTTIGKENAKQAASMAKEWQNAGHAIQSVGTAMQQIENPAAKVMGIIAQAVATMALSYAQAANSPAVTGTGWGWIAFAASGVATMLSSIAAIKQATSGYADGGIIKGNTYSGDLISANGGSIGLNAGEVILNRAQQGNLASQLEDSRLQKETNQPYVTGELLFLAMNNYAKRKGMGEIVTGRR